MMGLEALWCVIERASWSNVDTAHRWISEFQCSEQCEPILIRFETHSENVVLACWALRVKENNSTIFMPNVHYDISNRQNVEKIFTIFAQRLVFLGEQQQSLPEVTKQMYEFRPLWV